MYYFIFTNLNYIVSLIFIFFIIRFFVNGPKTSASRDIKNQIIIVTGSSAGIGKETARDLLNKGAKVIFACRDRLKTLAVIDQISNESTKNNAFFMKLNLSSFKSVVEFINDFSKKFDKLDMLINNAGVFLEKLTLTEDNLETDMQTNHISHFALTGLLLKYLKKSDDPRIINVSSDAHKFADYANDYFAFNEETFRMWKMYAVSKAANVYFSEALKELSEIKDYEYKKILSASVHPGAVFTEISRTDGKAIYYKILTLLFKPMMIIFFKNEEMGAQTTLHCCYISKEDFINGGYYKDCKNVLKGDALKNKDLERRIHKLSYEAVMNSTAFEELKNEENFKIFMEFFKKKF